jgi:hypothetical protein
MEEARAAAAVAFGDFDAHHAEIEQLFHEAVRNRGALVHLANERPDFAVGELVDAVVKQPLVLGEVCQREPCRGAGRSRHSS